MMRRRLRIYEPIDQEGSELAHPLNEADFDVFSETLDGRPLANSWKPIAMEIVREDEGRVLQESDCPWLGSWALVFRPSVMLALGPILRREGELLPLQCKQAKLVVFNPTNRLDALDEAQAEVRRFRAGGIIGIDRHAFRPEVIADHVAFKITSLRASPTYVTQEFVDAWKEAGLRGLDFKFLWEG